MVLVSGYYITSCSNKRKAGAWYAPAAFSAYSLY